MLTNNSLTIANLLNFIQWTRSIGAVLKGYGAILRGFDAILSDFDQFLLILSHFEQF